MRGFSFFAAMAAIVLAVPQAKAQEVSERLDSTVVSASRANSKTPVPFTMVGEEQLRSSNPINSLPMTLALQPSVVVTNEEYFDQIPSDEKIVVTKGGLLRKDSVYNGLKRTESDYVLIHDGARPFLHAETLEKIKEKVVESKAVISGRYAIDTIKIVKDGVIEKTIDRKTVFNDASLAESLGYKVAVVADAYNNRKLTKEEDFKDL